MFKRGISPLLAYILLFGFAVAMAVTVMNWAKTQAGNFDPSGGTGEIYCDGIDLKIVNIDRYYGYLNITLKNGGVYRIGRLTVQRSVRNYTVPSEDIGSCVILNTDSSNIGFGEMGDLMPGNNYKFSLSLGGELTQTIGDNLCSMNPGKDDNKCGDCKCPAYPKGSLGDDEVLVEWIAIVPWVEIEDSIFSCSEKKISLDKERDASLNICITPL